MWIWIFQVEINVVNQKIKQDTNFILATGQSQY